MCACEWNYVCSGHRGDWRFDWRLAFEPDPAEEPREEYNDDGRVKPPLVRRPR